MKNRFILLSLLAPFIIGCAGSPKSSVPVFDLHSDILLRAINNDVSIGDPPAWTQVSIPTMRLGNVQNQVLSVWVNSYGVQGEAATNRANQMIDIFEEQQARYSQDIALARNMAEAEAITGSGRIAAWLWLEGGAPIDNSLEQLRAFYDRGVRGMTLTWNNNLLWAGASQDKDNPGMGLTEFGREVIVEMNRLGMVIDISHVSDATFYDTINASADPIVASHSSCRALADHPRNMSDEMLRALANNGGVIGINALPSYLSTDWEKAWDETEKRISTDLDMIAARYDGNRRDPRFREARRLAIQAELPSEAVVTLEDYLDHIEHAVAVAGYQHVGLGSDFDGIWAFPVGLEKPSKWQSVADGLRARGHSDQVVRAIMHDNVARVFREVMD